LYQVGIASTDGAAARAGEMYRSERCVQVAVRYQVAGNIKVGISRDGRACYRKVLKVVAGLPDIVLPLQSW
jgi:hypothetical protein